MASGQPFPTLTPTGTGGGWRLPAVAVGVALVALVALTRLGGADRPTPSPRPSAAAAVPNGGVSTAAPDEASITVSRLGGVMRRSPDGLTYADGIPTGISGQAVYRVRDALLVPVGRTLLVGGWYLHRSDVVRECVTLRGGVCASATISDVPLSGPRVGDVTTAFVAVDSYLGGTGAYVLLATIEADPHCSIFGGGGVCQPRLRVLSRIWSDLG